VNQLPTSVVREIRTLRSVGAGARATAPGHPVAVSNDRPYRDLMDHSLNPKIVQGWLLLRNSGNPRDDDWAICPPSEIRYCRISRAQVE